MSNNNNNKESWALRQQKYTNAIIRGRRHVPTPEPIPPSTLLDAPKLPDVPLPSPPRERVRNNRPPNLVTNLKKRHPAPQGGYTSANRYAKTPTHPDENADAVGRYIDKMADIKSMQDNMGEKKNPHKSTSQCPRTPSPVLLKMEDQWTSGSLGDKEGMTAGEQYGQKKAYLKMAQDAMGVTKSHRRKVAKLAAAPAVRRVVEEEEMLSLGGNETIPAPKQHKKRRDRKHKQRCAGEEKPAEDFQPTTMEDYFLLTAAMDRRTDGAEMKDLEGNTMETSPLTSPELSDFVVEEDRMYRVQDRSPQPAAMYLSVEDHCVQDRSAVQEKTHRRKNSKKARKQERAISHLVQENTSPLTSPEVSDFVVEEDRMYRVQDRSPVQEKAHRRKNSKKARKQERTILPSLTSDLGLTLQGSKLATPGVSLPSIGDDRGLVTKPAQLPDIQDEDLEDCEQLPLLEFGTKTVGKTVSATVTYETSKDHTKARSTKRRKTSKRSALKDKKVRRHRHESPDLANDEL